MFSGIIEQLGKVVNIVHDKNNLQFTIQSNFTKELKIDQSVAHNGVCLTVVEIDNDTFKTTAIEETLKKSNLSSLKINDLVNLERCIKLNDRLDGHIVQGHVDITSTCISTIEKNGSWEFSFNLPQTYNHLIVDKGSICVNGVSLTVVDLTLDKFSVAIIPYTFEHTNFKKLSVNDIVNLEFDILGKYILRQKQAFKP